MEGWRFTTEHEKTLKAHMVNMIAEPVIGEIDDKIRDLASDLHYKITTSESQWVLMLTPLSLLNNLKDQIDGELERRRSEARELIKEEE